MRERECPECGGSMEFQSDDPDTGIIACWFCTACDHTEAADNMGDDLDLDRP
jgi:phage/plasmid primase-like uncharacterized protein